MLGSGASIEAKEIDGGLAWRIRYEGEGERTIEEETWTFDFDETLFIDGRIGEFAVVARRVGKKWFVGCLNAGERRDFSIPLDFAGNGALKVRLFRDANPDDAKPLAAIAVEELSVSAKESLKVAAAANGGWAAI
ncbi:MAG: glycoside hydrolase family 97 C-terminal domain-containing protein, partial [Kiritimatiellia bacterium]